MIETLTLFSLFMVVILAWLIVLEFIIDWRAKNIWKNQK